MTTPWYRSEATLQWAQQPNHHLILLDDLRYPPLLKSTHNAPPALMVMGNPALLLDPQLAIVGSRQMTAYGRDIAFEFAKHLAQSGLTITSGLAAGIDTQAHQGALAGNGHTIAVLGTGIDQVYPAQNLTLAHDIAQHGCLVSCFPLGMRPDKTTFPQRNRIITGLSLGVLIVEAAMQSGSLVSARLAMEQGREVFAIPGSIHNPMSKGCHHLLQQGAKLVQSSDDIFQELQAYLHAQLELPMVTTTAPLTDTPVAPLDPDYQTVLQEISSDPLPIDIIIERTGMPSNIVSSILLMLEMQNYIESTVSGYVRRRREESQLYCL